MYKSYVFVVLINFLLFSHAAPGQEGTADGKQSYTAFLEGVAKLSVSAETLTPEKWREFESSIRNHFYSGQWEALATSVLDIDIDYWYMYYLLGKAAIGLGRLEQGVAYYRTTIDKGEHQRCINSDRNICREWIQSVREALPDYENALQLDEKERQKFILLKNVKHVRLYACTLWAVGSDIQSIVATIPSTYKEIQFPVRRRYVSREELISDCMKENGMERIDREWEFTGEEIDKILIPAGRLVLTRSIRDRECSVTVDLTNRYFDIINPEVEVTFFDRDKNSLGKINLLFPAIFSNKQHAEVVRDIADYCEVIDSAYVTGARDRISERVLQGVHDQFFNVQQAD